MKYQIKRTTRFKREFKKSVKRGYDLSSFEQVVFELASGNTLSRKYQDHPLSGTWSGYRECHITPDWLLIYQIKNEILILVLAGIGTHSDLY